MFPVIVNIFFFKQTTAYDVLRSLVGSEMCIRDMANPEGRVSCPLTWAELAEADPGDLTICLLYTSDAADDLLCVGLGGRRIIKKTTNILPLTLLTSILFHSTSNSLLSHNSVPVLAHFFDWFI